MESQERDGARTLQRTAEHRAVRRETGLDRAGLARLAAQRLDGEGSTVGGRIRRTATPQGAAGAGCGPCCRVGSPTLRVHGSVDFSFLRSEERRVGKECPV